jgi:hypothetical protein
MGRQDPWSEGLRPNKRALSLKIGAVLQAENQFALKLVFLSALGSTVHDELWPLLRSFAIGPDTAT